MTTTRTTSSHPGPGDLVCYRDFLGAQRTVEIIEWHDDVKNGRPGFDGWLICQDGELVDGRHGVWGYESQIVFP
jgi:hypothetical protein